jgi:aryl-alcohol dehydrogenase-like predicted oxidoreductase
MVQRATAQELRSVAMFNRLTPLQDAGDCQFMFVAAENAADATWMIENSPVAGVMLPFGLADQTAGYRAIPAAREHGMGLIARRPTASVWQARAAATAAEDIAFVLAYPEVASVVEPFPHDREELYAVLAALRTPMTEEQRLHWWFGFSQQVGDPPAGK